MITLKIKYNLINNNQQLLLNDIIKQYNNAWHIAFNLYQNNKTPLIVNFHKYNNLNLLDGWLISSAINNARYLINYTKGEKIIFGGKENFIKRCKGLITKDTYNKRRLRSLCSIGERNSGRKRSYGNRRFRITEDCSQIIFKSKYWEIPLQIYCNKKLTSQLQTIYQHQIKGDIPITYYINNEYVYIAYDEIIHQNMTKSSINNRIMAIDLNPNYIGYSIIDWTCGNKFKLINSGVYSIKFLNDNDFALNGKGLDSSNKQRLKIVNKRKYELHEIAKHIIKLAIHYNCSIFAYEDLDFKSQKHKAGKYFNNLVNNMWNRRILLNNVIKRCCINNISTIKVIPDYSSFIGNFIFRSFNLPDMILASIEISRRAYEYNCQYIIKTKNPIKNIIQPIFSDFDDLIIKSLEEFNINEKFENLVDIYSFFKKSKLMYRLSLDQFKNLKFSRLNSNKSKIEILRFNKQVTI